MITLFAGQAPTIMNSLQGAKQRVFDIENQIPFIETQVIVDIPSPAQITSIFQRNFPTQEQFEFATGQLSDALQTQLGEEQGQAAYQGIYETFEAGKDLYNDFYLPQFKRLKAQCEKVEKTLQKLIDQIDKILVQLTRIERIFASLDGFISFLTEFIPLLRTLIGVAQIGLVAQVFPIASGVVTVKLGDAIKYAKSKLKEIDALAKIVDPIADFVRKEISEIRNVLYPVRNRLQEILTQIRARRLFIDSVFLDKLKELELSMAQNPPSEGGVGGPQGTGIAQDTDQIVNLLSSQVNPEDILDNLENSSKQKFIEYLIENGSTGYQIVKR